MLEQDQILEFLRTTGPTIPGKVAKNINTDILLASAHLSDLTSQGKVKISHLKIGGTPLYYLPGQEEQLFKYAEGNIKKQDFQALQLLQEKKILREIDLELLPRYAFRTQKDFAVPLTVTVNGQKELFWKWHLLSETEINPLISGILSAEVSVTAPPEKLPELTKPIETEMQKIEEPPSRAEEPLMREKTAPLEKTKKIVKEKTLVRKEIPDKLFQQVEHFLKDLNLQIENKETIRKNGELNLLLKVPSVIGKLNYFCKVKQKLRCDEKDLSSAYMEAQMKKLPLLFIYTEELSKKAQEMIAQGAFENMVLKRLK